MNFKMIPIMKTKLILICFTLLFISCSPEEEGVRIGFMFRISNTTDLEYENIKITIGGIKNGSFVGTESYTLPTIRIRNNNSEAQFAAVDHNRWRPDLNLVQTISEKAYFTLQLEGESPILLYDSFDDNVIVSACFTKNENIIHNYGGNLNIIIYENSIKGLFFEQE